MVAAVHPPLTILIPIYNEEPILEQAVTDLRAQLAGKVEAYQLILCENGSRDRTPAIAQSLAADHPEVETFSIGSPGQGNYGKALKLGMERARHPYVFCFEIDYWKVEFIDACFREFDAGAELVIASKQLATSQDQRPLFRRVVSRIYNLLLRLLFGFTGTETHGIKGYQQEALAPVIAACVTERDVFASELVMRAERQGNKRVEVPIAIEEIRPQRVNVWRRVPNVLRNFVTLYRVLHQ